MAESVDPPTGAREITPAGRPSETLAQESTEAQEVAELPRPVARPATVSERVQPFQAAREQAEREQNAAEEAARSTPPATPTREAWGDVLNAFMEQKHIRWGELAGGLLIVSCSIALVISFWDQIAQRTWLKFGVFNGVTAALFAAGLHAAKRWKLPTTSQGLLIIATLLVPLNFLAMAAFSADSDGTPASPWRGKSFPSRSFPHSSFSPVA